jgi:hypothetical protein
VDHVYHVFKIQSDCGVLRSRALRVPGARARLRSPDCGFLRLKLRHDAFLYALLDLIGAKPELLARKQRAMTEPAPAAPMA